MGWVKLLKIYDRRLTVLQFFFIFGAWEHKLSNLLDLKNRISFSGCELFRLSRVQGQQKWSRVLPHTHTNTRQQAKRRDKNYGYLMFIL